MKRKPKAVLQVRTYEVFARALEEGIDWGWKRAHKHADSPTEEQVKQAMYNAVLGTVLEVFDFPEGEP